MRIDQTTLTLVEAQLQRLDQASKSATLDAVASQQPHLFDMVLMQKSLGATLETMDCLLEILLVSSLAAEHLQINLPVISDETMISELNRLSPKWGFQQTCRLKH